MKPSEIWLKLSDDELFFLEKKRYASIESIQNLVNYGVIDEDRNFTQLGLDVVKHIKDAQTEKLVREGNYDLVFDNDDQLSDFIINQKLSGNSVGIVTNNNNAYVRLNGEDIGILDAYYFWEIVVNGSSKLELVYNPLFSIFRESFDVRVKDGE